MDREKVVDTAKEILYFLFVTAVAFAWWMLMLLIISFVTLSVIRFTMEGIIITSIICTVLVDAFYVWRVIKKRRKA